MGNLRQGGVLEPSGPGQCALYFVIPEKSSGLPVMALASVSEARDMKV